jgi:hypothetical protein
VVQFVGLDPSVPADSGTDKVRYQLTSAQPTLGDADDAVALYEQRVPTSPEDVREYRFVATAPTSPCTRMGGPRTSLPPASSSPQTIRH